MEPGKREDEEEEEAFLSQPLDDDAPSSSSESQERGGSRRRVVTAYLRVMLEIAMAATIVYLLVAKPFVVQRETIRKTPVPRRTLVDGSTALGCWLTQSGSSTTEDLHLPGQPPLCPRRHVVQRDTYSSHSP